METQITLSWHDLWVLVYGAVAVALWGIFKVVLSKNVLEKLIVICLRYLAKNTKNSLDDELVQTVEEALKKDK